MLKSLPQALHKPAWYEGFMTRETTHKLMGGKLNVYPRENSGYWQCSAYLNGRNHRISTKEDSLARAKQVAGDWYLELRGKSPWTGHHHAALCRAFGCPTQTAPFWWCLPPSGGLKAPAQDFILRCSENRIGNCGSAMGLPDK